MPDTPKNPADDEAMEAARYAWWWHDPQRNWQSADPFDGFDAGWRAAMTEVARERKSSLFIRGYFSDRIWNGEEPNYDYPENAAPRPEQPAGDERRGKASWDHSREGF